MTKFPFTDLHSFKDFVGFVKVCAPDRFDKREDAGPDEQWTLELAFDGLRLGLQMAKKEKGPLPAFGMCSRLVEQAYYLYEQGRTQEGFYKLDEVQRLLKMIRTK